MSDPLVVRRDAYINYLYGLENGLRSDNGSRAANARQALARLRHAFIEGRKHHAYEIVFRQDPPNDDVEAETWLLVGGLFALHPMSWRSGGGPRSLGASLGRLRKKLDSPAVDRRLSLLLVRDEQSLPHYLRQTIRLLSAHDVPVHYRRLLDDLIVLLGKDHRSDKASSVRLKWAQEYYTPLSDTTSSASDEPATDIPETTA